MAAASKNGKLTSRYKTNGQRAKHVVIGAEGDMWTLSALCHKSTIAPPKNLHAVSGEQGMSNIGALAQFASNGHEEKVKEILTQLFPPIDWVFVERSGREESDGWLRDLRVCSEDMFDRYFLLAIPEGGISEEEFGQVISSLGDRGQFVAKLKEAAERKTLEHLLGRLGARESVRSSCACALYHLAL